MAVPNNAEVIRRWSAYASEHFTDQGDFAREHLLNPVIFAMLGDVAGRRVLDAGCGQGYLARLLAARGALVTGVEPAEAMYRYINAVIDGGCRLRKLVEPRLGEESEEGNPARARNVHVPSFIVVHASKD